MHIPSVAAEQRKAKFRLDPASCTSWGKNHSLRPILSPDPLQPHLPPPQEGMHQTARVKGRETPMHIPSVASEQRKAKFRLDPAIYTSWRGIHHSLRPILSLDPFQSHLPPPQEGMHQTAIRRQRYVLLIVAARH